MGGHQVVANLAALCFMLPLSLSVATATLTAQAIGADDPRRARATALTGMRIAALVAAVTALLVWTLRGGIVRLYSRDPAVVATALTLIPFLAAFHFFDALQVVASFVLRAYKLAIAPTVIHATALWGLGVVGGSTTNSLTVPALSTMRSSSTRLSLWIVDTKIVGIRVSPRTAPREAPLPWPVANTRSKPVVMPLAAAVN